MLIYIYIFAYVDTCIPTGGSKSGDILKINELMTTTTSVAPAVARKLQKITQEREIRPIHGIISDFGCKTY